MQTKALPIVTAVSIACAFYFFVTPPTLEESADVLQQFSLSLKGHPPSDDEKKKIGQLANKSILIPKFAKSNVVSATGINFLSDKNMNMKPVVISARTGNAIHSCGKVSFKLQEGLEADDVSIKKKNTCAEIISIENEDVRVAMGLTEAVKGKVKVDGKEKEAVFVVTTDIFYEGSECTIKYLNGEAYLDCQASPTRPTR